jgi:hypothetical protein
MQRAECTPVQNDSNYIQLKREITKQFTEPKRQIKMGQLIIIIFINILKSSNLTLNQIIHNILS